MKRQQKDQTEGVTEDDLNEIKQDISAFRYENLLIFFHFNLFIFFSFSFELLEILSTNGFNVQSMKKNPGL
jgi:hypothetical protein